MISTLVVADTETSGLDPAAGAALLEVAWVPLLRETSGRWVYGSADSTFVAHEGPIPPEARAVHHIGPDDVRPGAPGVDTRDAVLHALLAAEEPGSMAYVFHNARFDTQFLPELGRPAEPGAPGCPTVCSMRCAMHLFPSAPGFSNQVLRYWLGAEPPEQLLYERQTIDEGSGTRTTRYVPLAPHRALYDAAVTAAVLLKMLEIRTPEDLVALTAAPVLLTTCRFGKHRGTAWRDVPRDYLSWMLRSSDMLRDDADLAHTVRHHLGLPAA